MLIGDLPNEYIRQFLCVKISPFDFIFLPDSWLPGVNLKKANSHSKDKFEQSGYKVKVALYFLGIQAAQGAIICLILNILFGLPFLLFKHGVKQGSFTWARNLTSKLVSFSLIAYPLRYLNENFLQVWGTLAIDINSR